MSLKPLFKKKTRIKVEYFSKPVYYCCTTGWGGGGVYVIKTWSLGIYDLDKTSVQSPQTEYHLYACNVHVP